MIDKINNTGIQEFFENQHPRRTGSPKAKDLNQADATIQLEHTDMINQANQITPKGTEAIQKAKQLLISGRLDSPEFIRQAAQNIVEFDI